VPTLTLTSGADRDRTDDLRLAKPALSQLSYSPESVPSSASCRWNIRFGLGHPNLNIIEGQGRLELPTSRLSGVRSNHLSYWPGWHGRQRSSRHRGPSNSRSHQATSNELKGIAIRDHWQVPENRVLFLIECSAQRKVEAAWNAFEY